VCVCVCACVLFDDDTCISVNGGDRKRNRKAIWVQKKKKWYKRTYADMRLYLLIRSSGSLCTPTQFPLTKTFVVFGFAISRISTISKFSVPHSSKNSRIGPKPEGNGVKGRY
jgi:hypothetical protein